MPLFIRKILLRITGYAKLLILLGVGLIVAALWSQWKADGDHAYTQREQLQTVSGFVKEASEITITGKRGRTKKKYYEILVTPKEGPPELNLRISFSEPQSRVANLVEEQITALYDPDDNHLLYEAAIDNQAPEITFERTRDRLLAEAKATAGIFSGSLFWVASIALILLGVGAIVLDRKLAAGLPDGD